MKFTVTMKDPDTLHDAIRRAVKLSIEEVEIDADEKESIVEMRIEKALEACSRWFGYSECLTVEVDTEAMTCVVQNDQKW